MFHDPPSPIGVVDDRYACHYLREHILAVSRALAAGVGVRSYFVWSLLDNLEWSYDCTKRFGIMHVDFARLQHTPKSERKVYAGVVKRSFAAWK